MLTPPPFGSYMKTPLRRWLIVAAMCVFACQLSVAREFPQSASGKVVDSYNRELMKEFRADLLRPDSSFIKSYFPTSIYSYNQPMNLRIDSFRNLIV